VASARSFDLPFRFDRAVFRSRKTGTERERTGCSWRRNGARFLVAGLDALTRRSRSSRVGRRFVEGRIRLSEGWPGSATSGPASKDRFLAGDRRRGRTLAFCGSARRDRRDARPPRKTTLAPFDQEVGEGCPWSRSSSWSRAVRRRPGMGSGTCRSGFAAGPLPAIDRGPSPG